MLLFLGAMVKDGKILSFFVFMEEGKEKIELCNQQKSLEENIALTMVMAVEYSTPTKWIFFFAFSFE